MIFIRSAALLLIASVLTTCSHTKIEGLKPELVLFPDFTEIIIDIQKSNEIIYKLPNLEHKYGSCNRDN